MNRAQRRAIKYGNLYNNAPKKAVRKGGSYKKNLVKLRAVPRYLPKED